MKLEITNTRSEKTNSESTVPESEFKALVKQPKNSKTKGTSAKKTRASSSKAKTKNTSQNSNTRTLNANKKTQIGSSSQEANTVQNETSKNVQREIAVSDSLQQLALEYQNNLEALEKENAAALAGSGDGKFANALKKDFATFLNQFSKSTPKVLKSIIEQAFGENVSANILKKITKSTFLKDVKVVFVSDKILKGAQGAYHAKDNGKGVIFLSNKLFNNPSKLMAVFAEEFGHHIDIVAGKGDSKGDEGAIFARGLMQKSPLDKNTLTNFKQENDHGIINIKGKNLSVEFSRGKEFDRHNVGGNKFVQNNIVVRKIDLKDSNVILKLPVNRAEKGKSTWSFVNQNKNDPNFGIPRSSDASGSDPDLSKYIQMNDKGELIVNKEAVSKISKDQKITLVLKETKPDGTSEITKFMIYFQTGTFNLKDVPYEITVNLQTSQFNKELANITGRDKNNKQVFFQILDNPFVRIGNSRLDLFTYSFSSKFTKLLISSKVNPSSLEIPESVIIRVQYKKGQETYYRKIKVNLARSFFMQSFGINQFYPNFGSGKLAQNDLVATYQVGHQMNNPSIVHKPKFSLKNAPKNFSINSSGEIKHTGTNMSFSKPIALTVVSKVGNEKLEQIIYLNPKIPGTVDAKIRYFDKAQVAQNGNRLSAQKIPEGLSLLGQNKNLYIDSDRTIKVRGDAKALPNNLTISIVKTDPKTGEKSMHSQRFIFSEAPSFESGVQQALRIDPKNPKYVAKGLYHIGSAAAKGRHAQLEYKLIGAPKEFEMGVGGVILYRGDISKLSGQIKFKVEVSDGRLTTQQTIAVYPTARPVFAKTTPKTFNVIAGSLKKDDEVLTVSAASSTPDINSEIKYSFRTTSKGSTDGANTSQTLSGFSIDAKTGKITFTGNPNNLSAGVSIELIVVATIGNINVERTIKIKSDASPKFTAASANFGVVSKVEDRNSIIAKAVVIDKDNLKNELTFSLKNNPAGFAINSKGEITFSGDRNTFKGQKLTVRVNDPLKLAIVEKTITILADIEPKFVKPKPTNIVIDNSAKTGVIGSVQIKANFDRTPIKYTLKRSDGSKLTNFNVDKNGQIHLTGDVRKLPHSTKLRVVATQGNKGAVFEFTVEKKNLTGSVKELTKGLNALDLSAVLPSGFNLNNSTFAIISGNDNGAFEVQKSDGKAQLVSNGPDRNNGAQRSLEIHVKDGSKSAILQVKVGIAKADKGLIVNNTNSIAIVANTASAGSYVTTIDVENQDGAAVKYTLIGTDLNKKFSIDSNTGVVTVKDTNPKLNASIKNLVVKVTYGGKESIVTKPIGFGKFNTVQLMKTNSYNVQENSVSGTVVGNVAASKQSELKGSPLNYSYMIIGGNKDNAFRIDEKGNIIVNGSIDYEAKNGNIRNLKIAISNGYDTQLVRANVTVQNVDEAPEFFTSQKIAMPSTFKAGEKLAALNIVDPEKATLTTSITKVTKAGVDVTSQNLGKLFEITADGQIKAKTDAVKSGLVNNDVITLTIQTSDGSKTVTRDVQILFTDKNPPLADSNQTIVTTAKRSSGTSEIGKVSATKAPRNTNPLNFSIISGNSAGALQIDAKTGALSLKGGALPGVYFLTVRVNQGGVSTDVVVRLKINPNSNAKPNVYENQVVLLPSTTPAFGSSSVGQIIGKLKGSGTTNLGVEYVIDHNAVQVNRLSGLITLKIPKDGFEGTVKVRAIDRATGGEKIINLTITKDRSKALSTVLDGVAGGKTITAGAAEKENKSSGAVYFETSENPNTSDKSRSVYKSVANLKGIIISGARYAQYDKTGASYTDTLALNYKGAAQRYQQDLASKLKPVEGSIAQKIRAASTAALNSLVGFAKTKPDALKKILSQAYNGASSAKINKLVQAIAEGGTPLPASVRVVRSEVLSGKDAAFVSKFGGVILISNAIISDKEKLKSAILEELGHFFDKYLGGGDSAGDEGAIFRSGVEKSRELTSTELQGERAKKDNGHIFAYGENVAAEFTGTSGLSAFVDGLRYRGQGYNALSQTMELSEMSGSVGAETVGSGVAETTFSQIGSEFASASAVGSSSGAILSQVGDIALVLGTLGGGIGLSVGLSKISNSDSSSSSSIDIKNPFKSSRSKKKNTSDGWHNEVPKFISSSNGDVALIDAQQKASSTSPKTIANVKATDKDEDALTYKVYKQSIVNGKIVETATTDFKVDNKTGNLLMVTDATTTLNGQKLVVKVKDTHGGETTRTLNLVTDYRPVFRPGNPNTIAIDSSRKGQISLGTIQATDADKGDTIRYTFKGNNHGFSINALTGEITRTNTTGLPAETRLTIVATGEVSGKSKLSSEYTFSIKSQNLTASFDEDSTTNIIDLSTLAGNGAVYKITGENSNLFRVSTSGQLVPKSKLDSKINPKEYVLTVTATKGGKTTKAIVSLTLDSVLKRVNISPKWIDAASNNKELGQVGIKVPAGVSVTYQVFAIGTKTDGTKFRTPTPFYNVTTDGKLRFIGDPTRIQDESEIAIVATRSDTGAKVTKNITVNIARPEFTKTQEKSGVVINPSALKLTGKLKAGEVIAKVDANNSTGITYSLGSTASNEGLFDNKLVAAFMKRASSDQKAKVKSALAISNGNLFNINTKTGEISLKNDLDTSVMNLLPTFPIVVSAKDSNGEVTQKIINISISKSPDFSWINNQTEFNVSAGASAGVSVGRFAAKGSEEITYSLEKTKHESNFTIDAKTGEIKIAAGKTLATGLDYELTLKATSKSGKTITQKVKIKPINNAPFAKGRELTVRQYLDAGVTNVGQILQNPPSGTKYKLINSSVAGFSVQESTSRIFAASKILESQDARVAILTVEATNPDKTINTFQVRVNLPTPKENVIGFENHFKQLREDMKIGTVIGKISATKRSNGAIETNATYSLLNGSKAAELFEINATTGEIKLKNSLSAVEGKIVPLTVITTLSNGAKIRKTADISIMSTKQMQRQKSNSLNALKLMFGDNWRGTKLFSVNKGLDFTDGKTHKALVMTENGVRAINVKAIGNQLFSVNLDGTIGDEITAFGDDFDGIMISSKALENAYDRLHQSSSTRSKRTIFGDGVIQISKTKKAALVALSLFTGFEHYSIRLNPRIGVAKRILGQFAFSTATALMLNAIAVSSFFQGTRMVLNNNKSSAPNYFEFDYKIGSDFQPNGLMKIKEMIDTNGNLLPAFTSKDKKPTPIESASLTLGTVLNQEKGSFKKLVRNLETINSMLGIIEANKKTKSPFSFYTTVPQFALTELQNTKKRLDTLAAALQTYKAALGTSIGTVAKSTITDLQQQIIQSKTSVSNILSKMVQNDKTSLASAKTLTNDTLAKIKGILTGVSTLEKTLDLSAAYYAKDITINGDKRTGYILPDSGLAVYIVPYKDSEGNTKYMQRYAARKENTDVQGMILSGLGAEINNGLSARIAAGTLFGVIGLLNTLMGPKHTHSVIEAFSRGAFLTAVNTASVPIAWAVADGFGLAEAYIKSRKDQGKLVGDSLLQFATIIAQMSIQLGAGKLQWNGKISAGTAAKINFVAPLANLLMTAGFALITSADARKKRDDTEWDTRAILKTQNGTDIKWDNNPLPKIKSFSRKGVTLSIRGRNNPVKPINDTLPNANRTTPKALNKWDAGAQVLYSGDMSSILTGYLYGAIFSTVSNVYNLPYDLSQARILDLDRSVATTPSDLETGIVLNTFLENMRNSFISRRPDNFPSTPTQTTRTRRDLSKQASNNQNKGIQQIRSSLKPFSFTNHTSLLNIASTTTELMQNTVLRTGSLVGGYNLGSKFYGLGASELSFKIVSAAGVERDVPADSVKAYNRGVFYVKRDVGIGEKLRVTIKQNGKEEVVNITRAAGTLPAAKLTFTAKSDDTVSVKALNDKLRIVGSVSATPTNPNNKIWNYHIVSGDPGTIFSINIDGAIVITNPPRSTDDAKSSYNLLIAAVDDAGNTTLVQKTINVVGNTGVSFKSDSLADKSTISLSTATNASRANPIKIADVEASDADGDFIGYKVYVKDASGKLTISTDFIVSPFTGDLYQIKNSADIKKGQNIVVQANDGYGHIAVKRDYRIAA